MIPILYKEDETNFNHNGIGQLVDTMDYNVLEARNGEFELELEYPVSGEWFDEIDDFRIISAKPNDEDEDHHFRIYETVKDLERQSILVYATTKTNDLGGNLVTEVIVDNETPQQAMDKIKANLIDPTDYNFVSDISTQSSTKWTRQNPLNCIAGEYGSLVTYWGGEIRRTNDTIYLHSRRGRDKVTTVEVGKNIEGLEATVSTKGMITRILPYFTYMPEGSEEEVTITGSPVNSPLIDNYPVKYTVAVDYSEYDNVVDLVSLNAEARTYFSVRNPDADKPRVKIEVDLVQLSDSSEYDKFRGLEHIALTDTVEVWVDKFNVDVEVKITEMTYNGLKEQVTHIVAGSESHTLYQDVKQSYSTEVSELRKYMLGVENGVRNAVQLSSDKNNAIFRGYTEPDVSISAKNDIWFKELGSNELGLYIFDGAAWQPEKYSAGALAGTINFANVNALNFNAGNITTGALDIARGITIGNNGEVILGIDADTGEATMNVAKLTINAKPVATLEDIEAIELTPGADGKTAYELAVEEGYSGTQAEWIESLIGQEGLDGKTAYEVALQNGFIGSQTEWLNSLKGTKGDPGTPGTNGRSVTDVDIEFYVSTSATALVGGGWVTFAPAWQNGKYIWTQTKTTYSSGDPTYTKPVNITGAKGTTGTAGKSVTSLTEEYAISTSKITAPTTFTTTRPKWVRGSYIWTRIKVVYANPTSTSYTLPVVDASWEAIEELELAYKEYADTKASAAQTAAQTYADTAAEAKRVLAEAYADGIVSAEETARIADVNAKLASAKADATTKANAAQTAAQSYADISATNAKNAAQTYADTKAEAERVIAEAYADDIVDAEEAARIADVNAKLLIAQNDATTKANNAKDAAIAAAKTDATTKANAAQAAAISAGNAKAEAERVIAEAYADGIVDDEEEARIADVNAKLLLAQNDATSKANTALSSAKTYADTASNAAKTAAQTYADTKAEAERVIAEAYADDKVSAEETARIADVNAKLVLAKNDATTKANAAQAAAISAAKTDATTKANAAQAAAISAANLKAVAERVIAEAYADDIVDAEEEARIADVNAKLELAKTDAATKANAALTSAKTYSDTTSNAAKLAAQSYADTKAEAERVLAEAYADDIVDAEEAARIADVNAKLVLAKNDATAKANAAQTAATNAAKLDATAKANAAQTAAISAANAKAVAERVIAEAYADDIVDAEETARIADVNAKLTLAKNDATAKANAAQTAAQTYADSAATTAKNAANTYANTKAEAERVLAEAYADDVVDAEEAARIADVNAKLTLAKNDATTKANAAKTAAISAAATDATTKANAAQAAAITAANTKAEAERVIAEAYADGIVTAEETARIKDVNAKLATAKADATTKANAAELAAKNHAAALDAQIVVGGRNHIVTHTVTEGSFITTAGALSSNAAWGVTDFFEVKPSTKYIVSGYTNLGSSPAVCFYTADNVLISGIAGSARATFTTPSTATLARFSLELKDLPTIKLERGTRSTDWTPSPEDVEAQIGEKADQANVDNLETALSDYETIVMGNVEELQSIVATMEEYYGLISENRANSESVMESLTTLINERIVAIDQNMGEFAARWSFLDTQITMGEEGMFLGQGDTGIFIQPRNGTIPARIDFVDGGTEPVAEITEQYMKINRAIFVTSMQVGEHKDESMPNGHTITTWVPGTV